MHGYSGLIRNWGINHCKEYDDVNEECSVCLNQYKLQDVDGVNL